MGEDFHDGLSANVKSLLQHERRLGAVEMNVAVLTERMLNQSNKLEDLEKKIDDSNVKLDALLSSRLPSWFISLATGTIAAIAAVLVNHFVR